MQPLFLFLQLVGFISNVLLAHKRTYYKRWCKIDESKEIKPQGSARFNVKNPPNTRGENHGRQSARTLL
jgi:hypothetical protein